MRAKTIRLLLIGVISVLALDQSSAFEIQTKCGEIPVDRPSNAEELAKLHAIALAYSVRFGVPYQDTLNWLNGRQIGAKNYVPLLIKANELFTEGSDKLKNTLLKEHVLDMPDSYAMEEKSDYVRGQFNLISKALEAIAKPARETIEHLKKYEKGLEVEVQCINDAYERFRISRGSALTHGDRQTIENSKSYPRRKLQKLHDPINKLINQAKKCVNVFIEVQKELDAKREHVLTYSRDTELEGHFISEEMKRNPSLGMGLLSEQQNKTILNCASELEKVEEEIINALEAHKKYFKQSTKGQYTFHNYGESLKDLRKAWLELEDAINHLIRVQWASFLNMAKFEVAVSHKFMRMRGDQNDSLEDINSGTPVIAIVDIIDEPRIKDDRSFKLIIQMGSGRYSVSFHDFGRLFRPVKTY